MPTPPNPPETGRITALWRYPVKSLCGEPLERAPVTSRGVEGDRLWAVRDPDGKLGSGKSTRRFRRMPGLLELTARYDGAVPVVTLPDGHAVRGDEPAVHDALSKHVGRPVTLAREEAVSHFDDGPLHLVTSSSLRTVADGRGEPVDVRRTRPNLVIDTGPATGKVEETWIGRRLAVGPELVIEVRDAMPRCVMVTQPQADLPADGRLLADVTELNDGCLGVVADVVRPGEIAVGDEVRLLP